ncbi:MAG: LPP20 family lipoprotein [Spirochaetales bacterium]|nr:LPP20 family lipoprotein [Spirochaetales bacterium]
MKKITIALLVVMVALFAVSCASAPDPKVVEPKKSNLPDFVLNPPMATDAIYGVGYAKQSSMALSIKVAETNARADIASQIETTIQEAITAYAQEAGEGDNTQLISFVETITRQITDTTLSGATPQSRAPMEDGGVWVLMVYGKDALLDSFEEVAEEFERNDAAAFAEFKATQALEKLDYQLENNPTVSTPTK